MDRSSATFKYARRCWITCLLVAGVPACIPIVNACEWSYLIWGIRNKPADPLFRFVRDGKAGYINSSGKVVVQPTLPSGDNSGGEFHEGLIAVKDETGYRYMDRSGAVVFRTDAWLVFDFSEGLAPASRYSNIPNWGFIDRTGRFVIAPQYR
jgi:hypothetical protein